MEIFIFFWRFCSFSVEKISPLSSIHLNFFPTALKRHTFHRGKSNERAEQHVYQWSKKTEKGTKELVSFLGLFYGNIIIKSENIVRFNYFISKSASVWTPYRTRSEISISAQSLNLPIPPGSPLLTSQS